MKESQEQKVKMYAACLENIRTNESDAIQKERILSAMKKLPDTREISNLKDNHKLLFNLILDGVQGFRDAYNDLTTTQYRAQVQDKFDINDYLLRMVPNIKLLEDMLNHKGVVSKINVYLLRDYFKVCARFPKDFLNKWRELANQKITLKMRKKDQMKMVSQAAMGIKIEPPKPVPVREEVQEESSETPPPPPPPKIKQKTEQEKAREAKQKERERAKQVQRERLLEREDRIQRESDEKRKVSERRHRQQNLRHSDEREKDHTRNQKGKVIVKYIESRKDLACDRKSKESIGEYLAAKLDQFLKTSLEQMYDVACLKNKKNPKFGNELGYFAEQNTRVENVQEFYFQPNTKVYSLSYKHKHEIYCNLRIKEIKKEDELRYALEVKTNEGEKKIDKRIENYILKPRPKESDSILIPFREEKDVYRSQSVTISLEHVIYFLESHPWLKNSLLLFNVYHRF